MTTPFPANLGDLQTMMGNLLNDPSNTRYSTTEINQYLDLAQDRWNREARICRFATTLTVVAGTNTYLLSTLTGSTPLEIKRVCHKGIPLIKRSKDYFDMYSDIDWTTTTGTPTQYIVDLSTGTPQIILYPVPQANDAGQYLLVEYTLRHDPMANSSDTPFTAASTVNTLALPYAGGLAYEAAAGILEGDPTPETVKKVNSYRTMANQILSQIVQWYDRLDSDEPWRFAGGRNWHH